MTNQDSVQEFAKQAEQAPAGFLRELVQWLRHNKSGGSLHCS